MAVTVLLVKLLNPQGASSGSTMILASAGYDESANADASSGQKLAGALLNAVIFVAVIVAITFVMVLLFKYGCYKLIFGYLGFAVINIFFLITGLIIILLCQKASIHIDAFSLCYLLFNFSVVGCLTTLFIPAPLLMKQCYMVWIGIIVAYIFTWIPDWTSWVLLVAMALYDIAAVLIPGGPLKALVEMAVERNQAIPALIYESRPAGRFRGTGHWGGRRVSGDGGMTAAEAGSGAGQNSQIGVELLAMGTPVHPGANGSDGGAGATSGAAAAGQLPSNTSNTATNASNNATNTARMSESGLTARRSAQQQPLGEAAESARPASRTSRDGGGWIHAPQPPHPPRAPAPPPPAPPPPAATQQQGEEQGEQGQGVALRGQQQGQGQGVEQGQGQRRGQPQPQPRGGFMRGSGGPVAEATGDPPLPLSVSGGGGGDGSGRLSGIAAPASPTPPRGSAAGDVFQRLVSLSVFGGGGGSGNGRGSGAAEPGLGANANGDPAAAAPPPVTARPLLSFGGRSSPSTTGQIMAGLASNAVAPSQPLMAPEAGGEQQRSDQRDNESEEEWELGMDGVKLGLGDFIFYSLLVGKAAMTDYMTVFASFIGVIAGLGMTLLCLAIYRKALPALPFSIALGVLFYFLTKIVMSPYLTQLTTIGTYM
ncbi:hypothetical protein FOA52_008935 [Chlamydomonas sp. UWO 241]|nr:hypothetical protein FOA52_008935 [Chlamydomonas sp. UWO 241]